MKKSKITAAAVMAVCTAALIAPFIRVYKGATGKFSLRHIKGFALDFSEKADMQYLNLVALTINVLMSVGLAALILSLVILAVSKADAGRAFYAVSAVSAFSLFLVNIIPLFIGGLIEASIELYTQREIGAPKLFFATTLLTGTAFLICAGKGFKHGKTEKAKA